MKKDKTLAAKMKRIANSDLSLNYKYAYASAFFHRCVPQLHEDDYPKAFKSFLKNQLQQDYDYTKKEVISTLDISKLNLLDESGYIICSYHYDAYRMLVPALIKAQKKVAVVSSIDDTKESDKYNFTKLYDIFNIDPVQKELPILSAIEPDFVFKAKDLIDQGYILIVFVDAFFGLRFGKKKPKNIAEVNFLDTSFYARTGAAGMAYSFNVPMLPVVALKEENGVQVISYDPIYPDKAIKKANFLQQSTVKLFSILESVITRDVTKWESLITFYKQINYEGIVYKALPQESKNNGGNLVFNKYRFTPFQLKDKYFLLDKQQFLSYEVADEMIAIIQRKKRNKDLEEKMQEEQILIWD